MIQIMKQILLGDIVFGSHKYELRFKAKVKSNKNKLKNIDDQINIESKNSCLNKSLCRG